MNVGEATRALTGESAASGRMGLRVNLKSSGASVADLISGLSGGGSVRLKGIDVKKGNTGTMLAGALGLVSALNQFGGILGGVVILPLLDLGPRHFPAALSRLGTFQHRVHILPFINRIGSHSTQFGILDILEIRHFQVEALADVGLILDGV